MYVKKGGQNETERSLSGFIAHFVCDLRGCRTGTGGLALGFGEGCGCRKGESGDKAVCIGSDAGEGGRTVGLIGHVGGRYGTMDFSPLSSSIVPGRYRGLFPGKLLWWILGLMGTA